VNPSWYIYIYIFTPATREQSSQNATHDGALEREIQAGSQTCSILQLDAPSGDSDSELSSVPEGFADEHEHHDNFDFLPEQRGPSKLDTDDSNSESELFQCA
jgi:hypothetical protein